MDLRTKLEYFRKEHDDIQRFLDEWEGALRLAAREDDEERSKGLARLREAENDLLSIQEHCHAEERTVESPFRIYLDDASLARLVQEHGLLRQLTNDYIRELTFATLLRTGDLVGVGTKLLEQLRRHITYETALLKQIEDGRAAEEKVLLQYTHPGE